MFAIQSFNFEKVCDVVREDGFYNKAKDGLPKNMQVLEKATAGVYRLEELRTLSPQGVATTLRYPDDAAIVRDALGQYHADVLLTQPGTWYWRWQSGHPSVGVAEGRITVQPSRFTPE